MVENYFNSIDLSSIDENTLDKAKKIVITLFSNYGWEPSMFSNSIEGSVFICYELCRVNPLIAKKEERVLSIEVYKNGEIGLSYTKKNIITLDISIYDKNYMRYINHIAKCL